MAATKLAIKIDPTLIARGLANIAARKVAERVEMTVYETAEAAATATLPANSFH